MASTKNCVVCFKTDIAQIGGHVHKDGEKIIAAFCAEHKDSPQVPGCKGCYGEWKPEMGLDLSFGQLMYIDKEGIHPVDPPEYNFK